MFTRSNAASILATAIVLAASSQDAIAGCPPDHVPVIYEVFSLAELSSALGNVCTGDTIVIKAGTYDVNSPIVIVSSTAFTIEGETGKGGELLSILDGGNTSQIMIASAINVTLRNLVFQNGRQFGNSATTGDGAAMRCVRLNLIEGCRFQNNVASLGGGAVVFRGPQNTLVDGCVFLNNQAMYAGAVFHAQDSTSNPTSPTILNSSFIDNTATGTGGAVAAGGSSPTYDGCTFSGNQNLVSPPSNWNWAGGGAMHFNAGGSPMVINSFFTDNSVAGGQCGGAIWVGSVTNPVVVGNLLFCNNTCNGNESNLSGFAYNNIGGNEICDLCPADLNGDNVVNGGDLGLVVGYWDCCGANCLGDVNDDGCVNGVDLALVLGTWGPCP